MVTKTTKCSNKLHLYKNPLLAFLSNDPADLITIRSQQMNTMRTSVK